MSNKLRHFLDLPDFSAMMSHDVLRKGLLFRSVNKR